MTKNLLRWGTKRDTVINADWSVLCDVLNPPKTSMRHTDSDGRELPSDTFLFHQSFSKAECKALIDAAESSADTDFATISYGYRQSIVIIDPMLTSLVWYRIQSFIPPIIEEDDGTVWVASGLNQQWRLTKYCAGYKFEQHVDRPLVRSKDEKSKFTIKIHMNSNYKGGRTRFYNGFCNPNDGWEDDDTGDEMDGTRFYNGSYEEHKTYDDISIASVMGKSGLCLIYRQPPKAELVHDNDDITSGAMCVLRSDVMYTRRKGEFSSRLDSTFNEKTKVTKDFNSFIQSFFGSCFSPQVSLLSE